MTKSDILAKVERKEITAADALVLLNKLDKMEQARSRRKPQFRVAEKSGWCSVRPCTLPYSMWLDLLEADTVECFRQFLADNKNKFKDKNDD